MSVSVEKEVKFRLDSWADGERRLSDRGAELVEPRYFETNLLFDLREHSLEKRGEALRVRRGPGGKAWLTFKGPLYGSGRVKQRREYETAVANPDAVEEILRHLGLEERFRYEKYRAIYSLAAVEACLDETPIGCFVELEGESAAIERSARELGFSMDAAIKLSYPRLYQMYRVDVPEAPEFMVFSGAGDTS